MTSSWTWATSRQQRTAATGQVVRTDQGGRVEEVGNSSDPQSAHAGSDPAAVLQLANRKLLTVQQVVLNVPCGQSLERNRRWLHRPLLSLRSHYAEALLYII